MSAGTGLIYLYFYRKVLLVIYMNMFYIDIYVRSSHLCISQIYPYFVLERYIYRLHLRLYRQGIMGSRIFVRHYSFSVVFKHSDAIIFG